MLFCRLRPELLGGAPLGRELRHGRLLLPTEGLLLGLEAPELQALHLLLILIIRRRI